LRLEFSERVKALPPYLFAEIENIIRRKRSEGADIISLSIGDPDLPPPKIVLDSLKEEIDKPENHNYSFSEGEYEFRLAVSEWYKKRFNVDLDHSSALRRVYAILQGLFLMKGIMYLYLTRPIPYTLMEARF